MKKVFTTLELEIIRFQEADIIVCSSCSPEWRCGSYGVYGSDGGSCENYNGENPDSHKTCDIFCTTVCTVYVLNENDGVPSWGDNADTCGEWMSGCESYHHSSLYPNCDTYFFCETDAYGEWSFTAGSTWECGFYNTSQYDL